MMPAPKFPQYKTLIFETWPIERCIGYARNPRKNDHAVDRVASAIREFGFRVPIVAKSDGTVVDGHLRLKAAAKLSLDRFHGGAVTPFGMVMGARGPVEFTVAQQRLHSER